jgi:uncharacterized protein (TIGR02300 family)
MGRKFQLTHAFGLTNGSAGEAIAAGGGIARQFRSHRMRAGPRERTKCRLVAGLRRRFLEVKTVAKPELGNKHQCQNCGTKFFDLNKNPVICPKCGTVQQIASSRTARAAVAEKEEAEPDPGVELVSLDEVEAVEANLDPVAEDDVEIEDAPAEDTFLEEEEEDSDDVTGLIDGEIAPDEEP